MKMEKFKRIIAGVLALVMVVGVMSVDFVADVGGGAVAMPTDLGVVPFVAQYRCFSIGGCYECYRI